MENSKKCKQLATQVGLGLRPSHYSEILNGPRRVSWFEVVTENYLNSWGLPRKHLHHIRSQYELATHGVGLSLGSQPAYRLDYLKLLKQFIHEFEPFIVSDHLCWTSTVHHNSHDLLPLKKDEKTLTAVCQNIGSIQDFLGQTIAIENVSQYVCFADEEMEEVEFIHNVCQKTGCKWLLDINNVYVNGVNFQKDPYAYINQVHTEHVVQYHIAGHTPCDDYLFDTHRGPVPREVILLAQHTLGKLGNKPMLLEWDTEIPAYDQLLEERARLQHLLMPATQHSTLKTDEKSPYASLSI
ncbi:MAG: DUF692 domain-containing protein [Zetaproteobacteria bacterium]|nr:DUF692 domain-containing protein [Zetaproteobacteria bacterium]